MTPRAYHAAAERFSAREFRWAVLYGYQGTPGYAEQVLADLDAAIYAARPLWQRRAVDAMHAWHEWAVQRGVDAERAAIDGDPVLSMIRHTWATMQDTLCHEGLPPLAQQHMRDLGRQVQAAKDAARDAQHAQDRAGLVAVEAQVRTELRAAYARYEEMRDVRQSINDCESGRI